MVMFICSLLVFGVVYVVGGYGVILFGWIDESW